MKISNTILFSLILTGILLASFAVSAKKFPVDSLNNLSLTEKIKYYSDSLRNSIHPNTRFQANDSFIKYYEAFLETENSFYENIEGINSVMILRSPDNKIRITSWLVADNIGNYKSYAYVERKISAKSDKVQWKLREKISFDTKELENTEFAATEWPGGLIYQILPFKHKKQTCYLILSYHGLGQQTNRKTMDVIHFDKEEIVFGLPVFQRYKNDPDPNYRIVFNYSDQTTMTLRYDKELKFIVFDHLVPPVEMLRGSEEFMVPDGTYGAFAPKKKGFWLRIEDFGKYEKWKNPKIE